MGNKLVIGILGGMGTFATINVFKQYAMVFPAEKEWERPRIIIDNRCTMPSRVRAFLYGEDKEKLIEEMEESICNLINAGANKIILACNTSHLFLPFIYQRKKYNYENIIEDIIINCVEQINSDGVKEVFLLGTEGTIDSNIYQKKLAEKGIVCKTPEKEEYILLRECIEAVKQDKYSEKIKEIYLSLLDKNIPIILGCTEFPILYEKYKDIIKNKVYDPCLITLEKIKGIY